MCGAGFPPCWLFGLRQPNTGAYLGSFVGLMADSGRAHTKDYFPELLLPVSFSPGWARATPASVGDPLALADRSGSVSPGVTAPSPVSRCADYFVCPPGVESLFLPVLSNSCNQIPLAFKVWFSRNSSSRCQTPRLWSLTLGSEPSLQWVDFYGISVLLSVSHPPSSYGIWFYCDCTPPTIFCGFSFVFGCGVFFVSSSVFLSIIVQQLVVILVFSQEGVRARPSTPPSWFLISSVFFYFSYSSALCGSSLYF